MQIETSPHQDTATETQGDLLVIPQPGEPETTGSNYRVVLYDDDHTPIDDVVEQLMKATECTLEKAAQIVVEVEDKGRAVCFRGSRDRCRKVVAVLREIRLQCEVDCD